MITSKERAQLRSLANTLDTIFQIGKEGIGEHTIAEIKSVLEKRELIKLRVLETCAMSPREAARLVAERTDGDVVQVIGTRFVLYRPSEKHKTIILV